MENKEPSIVSIFCFGQLVGLVPLTGLGMTGVKDDVKWLRRIANIGFGDAHILV